MGSRCTTRSVTRSAALQADSPDNLAFGYEGKHGIGTETDGANTVMLMGARLYDPATGRFLQVDPVLGGSANAYDYVDQDPSNTTDLDGYNVWNGSPGKPAKFACNAFFCRCLLFAVQGAGLGARPVPTR